MIINVIPVEGLPYSYSNRFAQSEVEAIICLISRTAKERVRVAYCLELGKYITVDFLDWKAEFEQNPGILSVTEFFLGKDQIWAQIQFPKQFPWTKLGG